MKALLRHLKFGQSKGHSPAGRIKAQSRSSVINDLLNDFDPRYYRQTYPDLTDVGSDRELVVHYVYHGAMEGRNPSSRFNTNYYLQAFPEVAESGINPFLHFLKIGRSKGYSGNLNDALSEKLEIPDLTSDTIDERISDTRRRFLEPPLSELIAEAAELEPLVLHPLWAPKNTTLPPVDAANQILAMSNLHEMAEYRTAKSVVVIPHCRMSGATRVAGVVANALGRVFGDDEVLVVRTDLDKMDYPEWFPKQCRHINFAANKRFSNQNMTSLLWEFLRSTNPEVVVNVNSRLFWDALGSTAYAMRDSFKVYSYMFCYDINQEGAEAGYPAEFFYRHYDKLDGIITDSKYLENRLRDRFLIPEQHQKLITISTPVLDKSPKKIQFPDNDKKRRKRVFWAGRFDRQKRVDIVFKLAEAMPEADFYMWGKSVIDNADLVPSHPPENVFLKGTYAQLSDLPLHKCDVWLYTSQWDGVPTILIDVASCGIPLVGSIAGGTSEILLENLCQRIFDIEDIGAYKQAIETIFDNPELAGNQARRLSEIVNTQRSKESYFTSFTNFLGKF